MQSSQDVGCNGLNVYVSHFVIAKTCPTHVRMANNSAAEHGRAELSGWRKVDGRSEGCS